jgi:hypothetical protein
MTAQTALTRRRHSDAHREGWSIFWGDVRVGHIGIRAGVPVDVEQWGWSCGFYPGCDPGQFSDGVAETFEEARADFEEAWSRLLPTRNELHFELWRRNRDATAWKYRMHDERLPMPTQRTNGRSKCFCGAEITTGSMDKHIHEAHRGMGA